MKFNAQNLHLANDYIINKIVENPQNVNEELFTTAKAIYDDRALHSYRKQAFISKYPALKDQVKDALKRGESIESQIKFMVDHGMQESFAENLVVELDFSVEQESQEAVSNNRNMLWGILAIILFVAKCSAIALSQR